MFAFARKMGLPHTRPKCLEAQVGTGLAKNGQKGLEYTKKFTCQCHGTQTSFLSKGGIYELLPN